MGWIVGWKKSTNLETTPNLFPRAYFWIVSELPTIRSVLPRSAFIGTNPTHEPITSRLPVTRPESGLANPRPDANACSQQLSPNLIWNLICRA